MVAGLCSAVPSLGHLDVVCLLVEQGAEVSCKDKRGYTPLHAAASNGQIAVVKHLLSLSVEVITEIFEYRPAHITMTHFYCSDFNIQQTTYMYTLIKAKINEMKMKLPTYI